MIEPTTALREIRWLQAYNDSGETIPPFAAVRATDVDDDGVITVDKPNADGLVLGIFFNGPFPIQIDSNGIVTIDFPCYALYDTGDGTPALGDIWGVGNGSWKLQTGDGFYVVGGVTDERMMVTPSC